MRSLAGIASGGQPMSDADADAFVFFGATCDLAYEQIFPALQALT
jgi:glucose-6-phosphate 1-dehydrogenase